MSRLKTRIKCPTGDTAPISYLSILKYDKIFQFIPVCHIQLLQSNF